MNAQHGLIAIHTLWLREHNRVAIELFRYNPYWTDERLFQEARRVVIAELQHITYNEWLSVILGQEYLERNGLSSLESGYSTSYFGEGILLDQFDPAVSNEFAAAAFRFGHSLIPSTYQVSYERNGETVNEYKLRSVFFQPTEFREDGANNGDKSKFEQD